MSTDWLPALLSSSDHDGDWIRFLDAVYECFRVSFVTSRPNLGTKPVGISKELREDGRHEVFWHIICGDDGDEPIHERCAHMPWPRPLIEEVPNPRALAWSEKRGRRSRTLVVPVDFRYVVVLEEAMTHFLLVTAYPVTRGHTRKNLIKRFQAAKAA